MFNFPSGDIKTVFNKIQIGFLPTDSLSDKNDVKVLGTN